MEFLEIKNRLRARAVFLRDQYHASWQRLAENAGEPSRFLHSVLDPDRHTTELGLTVFLRTCRVLKVDPEAVLSEFDHKSPVENLNATDRRRKDA